MDSTNGGTLHGPSPVGKDVRSAASHGGSGRPEERGGGGSLLRRPSPARLHLSSVHVYPQFRPGAELTGLNLRKRSGGLRPIEITPSSPRSAYPMPMPEW